MAESNAIRKNELFYCEHLTLSRESMRDVENFSVTQLEGKGLVEYIQGNAFTDEAQGAQRIYLVRDLVGDELVAYFGLRTGLISTNERSMYLNGEERKIFDTISGIELAEIAVNEAYIDKHQNYRGCGLIIFNDFILPICEQVKALVGCEILYWYSVDTDGHLLERYLNDYKFKRLDPESEAKVQERFRPFYDKGCVFIYQKI